MLSQSFLAAQKKQIVLSFSGGKDSMLSLYKLSMDKTFKIISLLTTLDPDNRVMMQCIDSALLDEQAEALKLPLRKVVIPKVIDGKSVYASKVKEVLKEFKKRGVAYVAYGDIFLEDVKEFREKELSISGMENIYPLWGLDPAHIAKEFLDVNFKAVITCVNTDLISKEWIGKEYDNEFLDFTGRRGIDPCGENGEFHTFVYAGPIFSKEIKFYLDLEHPIIYKNFYACVAFSESSREENISTTCTSVMSQLGVL